MKKHKRSLSCTHRKLSKEWHSTKNGKLTPRDVTFGVEKKVWWLCPICKEEFQSLVFNRTRGQGCPYCAGVKVGEKNNLQYLYPELAKEWHQTKNGKLTPRDVTSGGEKKIWWKCPVCTESYEMMVRARTRGRGCPYCAGRRSGRKNNLQYLYPKLANEWHPTKNGKLTSKDVTPGSNKKVWWLCPTCNESYDSIIGSRVGGSGCSYCAGRRAGRKNNLKYFNPKLAKEWHPTKNGKLTSKDVTPGSNKKVWWLCPTCNESYDSIISSRVQGNGCSYCVGRRIGRKNNLQYLYPKLAKEWHPTKNGELTPKEVTPGMAMKVWWLCSICNENFKKALCERSKGTKCPYCARIRIGKKNNLKYLHPKLAKEWHPTKNGKLTSKNVTPGSNKKVWWLCQVCDKSWSAIISSRAKGHNCPFCQGMYRTIQHVKSIIKGKGLHCISAQYHNNKAHIHFRCNFGHDFWRTPISITALTRCPECDGYRNYKLKEVHEEAKLRYGRCLNPIDGPITDMMKLEFIDEHGEEFTLTPHELFGIQSRSPMWSGYQLYRK